MQGFKKSYDIDMTQNDKQRVFVRTVMQACNGNNGFKYFAYGGAIRGGKSYVTAFIFLTLAEKYRRTRWHVIRQDMPVLESTTIPTFQKLIGTSNKWTWHRDKANYNLTHTNGSKIIFKGENIIRDPLLNDFLGLETNGIWLEQAEELSERIWEKALERTGSWIVPDMPPGFIFLTFNPTQNWVKDKFYAPFIKEELYAPFFYMPALPKDNPFVTESQWQQWEKMARPYQQQFIEGDWSDLEDRGNLWAFAFDYDKHAYLPVLHPRETVYLSFDFNVNPMCCAVVQHHHGCLCVLEIIKLPNSSTEQMCDYILKSEYRGCGFKVTGDACGAHRHTSQIDASHNYRIIERKLGISYVHFNVPRANPPLQQNKVLVNSLLANYRVFIHKEKAKPLLYDLANVRSYYDGSIIKKNRNDSTQQSDALDCFRYFCNVYMGWFLDTIK